MEGPPVLLPLMWALEGAPSAAWDSKQWIMTSGMPQTTPGPSEYPVRHCQRHPPLCTQRLVALRAFATALVLVIVVASGPTLLSPIPGCTRPDSCPR